MGGRDLSIGGRIQRDAAGGASGATQRVVLQGALAEPLCGPFPTGRRANFLGVCCRSRREIASRAHRASRGKLRSLVKWSKTGLAMQTVDD